MRYRHLRHRYTIVVGSGGGWLAGTVWSAATWRLPAAPRWQPDADLYETSQAIEVVVDLAGVADEDVEVELFEDALVVEGRRELPACQEGAVYHAAGIRQGPFRVALPLPSPVDPDGVRARFERGLLRVTLPKRGT
jgi:HSP20 family protein